MKTVTSQDILSWNPCAGWDLTNIEETMGKSTGITVMDFVNCSTLKDEEILWAILRIEFFTSKQLKDLSSRFFDYVRKNTTDNSKLKKVDRLFVKTMNLSNLCIKLAKDNDLSPFINISKAILDG